MPIEITLLDIVAERSPKTAKALIKLSADIAEEVGRSFLVDSRGGDFFTDSRIVAKAFGKRHDDVLKAIRNLDCSTDFNARNFAAVSYRDEKGEMRPRVEMTRDGFSFLAMGFRGRVAAAWKERFIAAFNRAVELAQERTIKPLSIPYGARRVPSAARSDILVWAGQNQATHPTLARAIMGYVIGSAGDLPANLVEAFDHMRAELEEDRAKYPRRRVTRRAPPR